MYYVLGLFWQHFSRLPKDNRELAHWYFFEYKPQTTSIAL